MQDIKTRNAGASPNQLQDIIDDAVREVCAQRHARTKAGKVLMRVVLDSNILVSALIYPAGHPAAIYEVNLK